MLTSDRGKNKAPALRRRWVRTLRSVSISGAVGLAPYIGKARVPLFKQLLALFPQSIADVAIIFATAAMTTVAAYVEFRSSERTPVLDIDRKFRVATRCCIGLLFLLLIVYFVAVTRVSYLGGAETVSFVTGFKGSSDPSCAGMSRAQCILNVTHFDEANIDSVFGERQILLAKALLVIAYVGCMTTFAYLVALIVLKQAAFSGGV